MKESKKQKKENENAEKKYGCLFCTKRSNTEKGLNIHITKIHEKEFRKGGNDESYTK